MTTDIATRFAELDRARARLQQLGSQHAASLRLFYDEGQGGFQRKQEQVGRRNEISESSTATCVLSLIAANRWSTPPPGSRDVPPWKGREYALAHQLLTTPWESAGLPQDNPYTVAWMLEGVAQLFSLPGVTPTEEDLALVNKAREIILTPLRVVGSISLRTFPPSAYLTQLAVRALTSSAPLVGASGLPEEARNRVRDWSQGQLQRHIALLTTQSRLGDVYELAYATVLFGSTRAPGVGLPDDLFLIRAAIDRLFELQKPDGSWPQSHPLFVHREAGNAHCYEFEMLAQFVELRRHAEILPILLEHVPALIKAVRALDAERFELRGDASGWSSRFYPPERAPESWSTASAFHFAHVLDRLLAEAVRRLIFEDVGATYPLTLAPAPGGIEYLRQKLADSALPHPREMQRYSLLQVLWDQFIEPIRRQRGSVERGGSFDSGTRIAAILFGPPGTAKTELAQLIADSLGWPILSLDPSNFLRLGLDRVEAEADRIFGMLARADQLVVFLDEFDEMVRARATAKEYESRFLTTSMLPKLTKIRKTRQIVFLLATNHIEHFDAAIGRRGRFDLILQVMPPMAREKFAKHGLPVDLLADEKVRTQVAQLTWDEFRDILEAVKAGGNVAKSAVERAWTDCTLQDKVATDKKRWSKLCVEARPKVRFDVRGATSIFEGDVEPVPTPQAPPPPAAS